MAGMDAKLIALLTRNGVDQIIMDAMGAKNCNTLEDLANWVETRDKLDEHFINHTDLKNDGAQKARLRMAWRQAEAVTARSLERVSQGLANEALDEPLDDSQAKSLEEAFVKAYNTRMFQPDRVGRDILLGRIFREFQSRKPNMYQVAKVRSIGDMALSTGTIKRKIGQNTTITVDGEDAVADYDVGYVLIFSERLEILANTWALAGTFKVTYQGKDVPFAFWADCYDYVLKFRKECAERLGTFTEASIIEYATKVEEAFRLKVIEHVRGAEFVPWGHALTKVLKEEAYEWEHKKSVLIPLGRARLTPGPMASSDPAPRGEASGQREAKKPRTAQREASDYKRSWKTSKWNTDNQELCRRWNDVRGCKQKCPAGYVHACDVVLASGKTCGAKSHNRMGHKEAVHGTVARLR